MPEALLGNIQPSSKPNLFFTRFISSEYPNNKVTSFDVDSIAAGCFAAAKEGLLAPAISCKMRFTGVKAKSGSDDVVHYAEFEIGKVNLLGFSLIKEKLQNVVFPSDFTGLKSLKSEMVDSGLSIFKDVDGMAFDDFVHTVHIKQ